MRNVLFAAAAATALIASPAAAQTYGNGYAAPGAYDGPVVVAPYGAPMVESQVYLAPNTAYAAPVAPGPAYVAPGAEYADQPIFINGERYYRDCWWDWGQRRCELKRWW